MHRGILLVVTLVLGVGLVGCPPGATLRVENVSSHTLVEVNVVPSGSESWGANRLPRSMPPDTFYDIRNIRTGLYDFRAVTATGLTTSRFGVELTENTSRTWTILNAKNGQEIKSESYALTSRGAADYVDETTSNEESNDDGR